METGALAIRATGLSWSLDFGFPVQCVLAIELAVLHQFELSLEIPAVFGGRVVPPFAFRALQRYELHCFRLGHAAPLARVFSSAT